MNKIGIDAAQASHLFRKRFSKNARGWKLYSFSGPSTKSLSGILIERCERIVLDWMNGGIRCT